MPSLSSYMYREVVVGSGVKYALIEQIYVEKGGCMSRFDSMHSLSRCLHREVVVIIGLTVLCDRVENMSSLIVC